MTRQPWDAHQDLERLREKARLVRMEEHPFVVARLRSPLLWQKPKLRQQLDAFLNRQMTRQITDPHPFLPGPSRELAEDGDVELGSVVGGAGPEHPLRLRSTDYSTHQIVCGPSGAGKTHLLTRQSTRLAELGVAVWWFDTEDEMSPYVLANQAGDPEDARTVLVVNYADFRVNPFQGPQGVDARTYVTKRTHLCREELYFRDGTTNLVRQTCYDLLSRHGQCSLPGVFDHLMAQKYRTSSRTAGYWESAVSRFQELLGHSDTYNCQTSDSLAKLVDRSVVWRLQGASDDHVAFFIDTLLLFLITYRTLNPQPGLRNLCVLDELTRVANVGRISRADISEPFLHDVTRTVRKRGIGLLTATQTLSLVPQAITSNLSTVITFRPADGHNIRAVSASLGLDRDQAASMAELAPRRAVMRHPRYPQPLLLELPEARLPVVDKNAVDAAAQKTLDWLGQAPDVPRTAEQGQEPEAAGDAHSITLPGGLRIAKRSIDYLVGIARNPFLPVTERDRVQGVSSHVGNQIRQQLQSLAEGLIRLHRAPTGAKGRVYTLTEITQAGYRLLDSLEVRYEKPRGNGSYRHRFYQHLVHEWAVRQGYPARIEDEVDGKRVDVSVVWDEHRVAVEILVEGIEKELRNFAKDVDRGFDQIVFCAVDSDTLDSLRERIESEFGHDVVEDEIVRFVRIREFLPRRDKPKDSA